VGVGFDTLGAGKKLVILGPNKNKVQKIIIPDSREGWVQSVATLIDSYFDSQPDPVLFFFLFLFLFLFLFSDF